MLVQRCARPRAGMEGGGGGRCEGSAGGRGGAARGCCLTAGSAGAVVAARALAVPLCFFDCVGNNRGFLVGPVRKPFCRTSLYQLQSCPVIWFPQTRPKPCFPPAPCWRVAGRSARAGGAEGSSCAGACRVPCRPLL